MSKQIETKKISQRGPYRSRIKTPRPTIHNRKKRKILQEKEEVTVNLKEVEITNEVSYFNKIV